MKTFKFFLILTALTFTGFSSQAFITNAIPVGCGYSDFIFSEIPRLTGEKSLLNTALSGKQGETGRRFLMYSDHSWVMTFEFFSSDDVSFDLSCVVKTGDEDTAYEGTGLMLSSLPSERLGPALRAEDEARLKIQPQ